MDTIGYKLAQIHIENNEDSNFKNANIKIGNQISAAKQDKNESIASFEIPIHRCSSQNIFLFENIDFFAFYIFSTDKNKKCQELFIHLNQCYHCFSIFSQTMRDYFNKYNELSIESNGVAR